jgi:RNA polymerase primary sigma factor
VANLLSYQRDGLSPSLATALNSDPLPMTQIGLVDALPLFIDRVRRKRLLTAAQEVQLAKALERGDATARDALIEANLRLVIAIAKRYRGRGFPFLDLIQEGCIGLIEAVDRYDYRRRYRFSTYAAWLIEAAVKDAVRQRGRLIRLPDRALRQLQQTMATEQQLTRELGRKPSAAEISRQSGLSRSDVDEAVISAGGMLPLEALRSGRAGNERAAADAAATHEYELILLRQAVARALTLLDARERMIIERRFGFGGEPQTLQEIGRLLGLTHERVRQIQNESLDQLRALLAAG